MKISSLTRHLVALKKSIPAFLLLASISLVSASVAQAAAIKISFYGYTPVRTQMWWSVDLDELLAGASYIDDDELPIVRARIREDRFSTIRIPNAQVSVYQLTSWEEYPFQFPGIDLLGGDIPDTYSGDLFVYEGGTGVVYTPPGRSSGILKGEWIWYGISPAALGLAPGSYDTGVAHITVIPEPSTVIPEPSSAAVLAGVVTLGLVALSRRRSVLAT